LISLTSIDGPAVVVETNAKSTGTSTLHITQSGRVDANQSYYRDATEGYDNIFEVPLKAINNGKEVVAITNITGEYKKDDQWIKAPVRLSFGTGRPNYQQNLSFNFDPLQQGQLSVELRIFIKAPQIYAARR
jgi:hypothetical protein